MAGFAFLFFVGMYFLPTLVAAVRHKPNALAIAALNFLLGWSIVGWVVALIWALAAERSYQNIINVSQNVTMPFGAQRAGSYPEPYAPPYGRQGGSAPQSIPGGRYLDHYDPPSL
jgi:hypothetical protein